MRKPRAWEDAITSAHVVDWIGKLQTFVNIHRMGSFSRRAWGAWIVLVVCRVCLAQVHFQPYSAKEQAAVDRLQDVISRAMKVEAHIDQQQMYMLRQRLTISL